MNRTKKEIEKTEWFTAKIAKSAKGRGMKKENEQAAELVVDAVLKEPRTSGPAS